MEADLNLIQNSVTQAVTHQQRITTIRRSTGSHNSLKTQISTNQKTKTKPSSKQIKIVSDKESISKRKKKDIKQNWKKNDKLNK